MHTIYRYIFDIENIIFSIIIFENNRNFVIIAVGLSN